MAHQNSLVAPCVLIPIGDASAVGELRRFGQAASDQLGFDDSRSSNVAIVATELATNLIRHAKQGAVIGRIYQEGTAACLDLLAIDRGPGIRNIDRCMEDGYSTQAGGSGTGLGAVRRLADEFDIHSVPDLGTAVLARFRSGAPPARAMDVGALSLPYPGEQACGDAWGVTQTLDTCVISVVDGLGHGVEAALAAGEALKVLADPRRSAEQVLEFAHAALRPTRGAAMAVAEVRPATRHVHYAGVGNIVGATASIQTQRRMVSFDGTVGHEVHHIRAFDYALESGQVVIMHSDGLKSLWQLERYPGLLLRDPFLVAGVLYRDYCKGHDDVTVVVGRMSEP